MLQVEDFILRPNKFDGLNDLANNIERRNERQYVRGQQQQRRKDNLMDDALRYTDPAQFFTGTPQDPVITGILKEVLSDAAKMITQDENLDNAMLYTALAPRISKLSAASQNLKQIAANNKQRFDALKDQKDIDQDKLRNETLRNAYMNPDGTPKDLSQIDPSQDYVDYTLRNSDVYNNTGFDAYSKGVSRWTDKGQVKSIDSRGGYKKFNTKMSAPSFTVSEKDADGNHIGFVPKYEIATENGQPLMHEFQNADGTKTKAPVRLLDRKIMEDLPPGAKAFILQETRKFAKEHNVPLGSVQAENFGRALAYDELNVPTKTAGSVEVIEESKAPQIKVYNNSGSGKGAAVATDINDIYKSIDAVTQDPSAGIFKKGTDERVGTRFNKLNTDAQKVVVDFVNANRGDAKIAPEEIFIHKDNGEIKVYKVNGNGDAIPEKNDANLLGILPYVGTNTAVNKTVKEKQTVYQRAKSLFSGKGGSQSKPTKSINASKIKSLVGTKGYEGYTEDELKKYYQDNGYQVN